MQVTLCDKCAAGMAAAYRLERCAVISPARRCNLCAAQGATVYDAAQLHPPRPNPARPKKPKRMTAAERERLRRRSWWN